MSRVYTFKQGSRIKADAQAAGELCEQLANEGKLTAKELVNVSRDPNALLHNEFEWQDDVAAELYREGQARHIINCIVTETENNDTQRVFFNIQVTQTEYKHIDVICQSAEDSANLYLTALREYRAIERKYRYIASLRPIHDAIDNLCNQTNL